MEFTFTTAYDQKAMTAMARALRKTIRKKRSHRAHIFGWIVVVLGLLLTLPFGRDHYEVTARTVITWIAVVVILFVFFKEDAINGYIARKRMLPQLLSATTVFAAEGYHSSTEIGSSDFHYESIVAIAETADYFVFLFSKNHAQVYDKNSITGGTVDAFRTFIQNAAGHDIQKLS